METESLVEENPNSQVADSENGAFADPDPDGKPLKSIGVEEIGEEIAHKEHESESALFALNEKSPLLQSWPPCS